MKVVILAALVALSLASEVQYRPISERFFKNPLKWASYIRASILHTGTGRIVGGNEAQPGQFPFQAGLLIVSNDGTFFCGGSLLNEEYVLTAAHCADDVNEITVVLGAHKVKEEEPKQVRVLVPKANIKVHEKWNPNNLSNDIALLKLSEKVTFQAHIKAVSLPKRSEASETFSGEHCTTSGWGRDSDQAGGVSPVLRFVNTVVISNEECNESFEGYIQSSNICATGNGGKSACNGDSGGPLTVGQGSELTQVGVVSFGAMAGCEKGFPHVYSRVTSYLDWIEANSSVQLS